MKRSTFKRLHEIANDKFMPVANSCSSRTEARLLDKELEVEPPTLELEDVVPKGRVYEKFNKYISTSFFNENYEHISEHIEDNVKKILEGTRPGYWASWAHKSPYTSKVVRDYSAVEYTKTVLYKSLMNVFCGVKAMADHVEIPSTADKKLLILNGESEKHMVQGYLNMCQGHDSSAQLLRDVFMLRRLNIVSVSPFRLDARFDDNITGAHEVGYLFNEHVYKLLRDNIKPSHSSGGYNFYFIDYVTLLLCLLYEKFPREFSLNNEDALFLKVIEHLPNSLRTGAIHSVFNNINVMFIWSDTEVKNKALSYYKYKASDYPRHDESELSMEVLTKYKSSGASKKIDNKKFFNFEGFLNTTEDCLKLRKKIMEVVNL